MRLVYLCTADPPPPNSDWPNVQDFFKAIPEYLHPRTGNVNSPHMLFFADRMGSNWLPEFHDFAIAFISERFLSDENALKCLGRASTAFPNLVCIDLYNNLSPELLKIAQKYSKRIFSPDEGKEFLITTFPQIAAAYDLETERLTQTIETDGFDYLEKTISDLNTQKQMNKVISFICYGASLLILVAMLIFTFWRFCIFSQTEAVIEIQKTILICIEVIILSAIIVSISRFLFLLGKSFMVESIRSADRAHALGLGKLYLKLYKGNFKWSELRDVLQNWNIDSGSAFRGLDAKDIEAISLDGFIDAIKK